MGVPRHLPLVGYRIAAAGPGLCGGVLNLRPQRLPLPHFLDRADLDWQRRSPRVIELRGHRIGLGIRQRDPGAVGAVVGAWGPILLPDVGKGDRALLIERAGADDRLTGCTVALEIMPNAGWASNAGAGPIAQIHSRQPAMTVRTALVYRSVFMRTSSFRRWFARGGRF